MPDLTPDPTTTLAAWRADHTVTATWEGGWGSSARMTCHAPADALCHARWSCECEEFYDAGIRNGVPAHRPDPDDPNFWHAGTFDPDLCNLRDWFENTDDPLDGEVTFPVTARWEGEDYSFEVADAVPHLLAFAEAMAGLADEWEAGGESSPDWWYARGLRAALDEHLGGAGL